MHVTPAIRKFSRPCGLSLLSMLVGLILLCSFKTSAQKSAPDTQPSPDASASPVQSPTATAATPAIAQQSPQTVPTPTVSPSQPKVIGIETKSAGLGDLITLRVENLAALVQQSKCVGSHPTCVKSEIVMFLNGRPVLGEYPEVILPSQELVQFHLSRQSGNEDLWSDLLGEPRGFVKEVEASVGLENGYPLDSGHKFDLIVMHPWGFWSCFILLGLVLLSILYLARSTSLLRASSKQREDRKLAQYSLGRAQMAFWFVLVLTSFMLIWLITGEYGTITTSTLVLIGIGAGTALGAVLVDSSKTTSVNSLATDAEAEKAVLVARIGEIKSSLANQDNPPPDAQDLQKELESKQSRLYVVNSTLDQLQKQSDFPPSEGFFKDILSDNGGISLHRMQIVVWTIVLGIIFVNSVYNHLSMPEFNGTLLALMGISSGAYLGFKGTER